MLRVLYIVVLGLLQVMLAWQLVPVIAAALQAHLQLGTSPDGWPAVAQVLCAAVAVLGAGLSVGYPSIALMRHVQRGPQRFAGVPPWTVAIALIGAGLLAASGALAYAPRFEPLATVPPTVAVALPLGPAGVALMSAGVLFGEILRRNRPPRARSVAVVPGQLRRRVEPVDALRHAA